MQPTPKRTSKIITTMRAMITVWWVVLLLPDGVGDSVVPVVPPDCTPALILAN